MRGLENCLEVLQLQFIFDGLVHKTVEVPQLLLARWSSFGQGCRRAFRCALLSWPRSFVVNNGSGMHSTGFAGIIALRAMFPTTAGVPQIQEQIVEAFMRGYRQIVVCSTTDL